jgi:hypothetical protein
MIRTRRLSDFDPWDFVSLLWIKHGPTVPNTSRMCYDILDYVRRERLHRKRFVPAGLSIRDDEPTEEPVVIASVDGLQWPNTYDWEVARMVAAGMDTTQIQTALPVKYSKARIRSRYMAGWNNRRSIAA